jgi:hypothetical protein
MLDKIGRDNVRGFIQEIYSKGLFDDSEPSSEEINLSKLDTKMCGGKLSDKFFKFLQMYQPPSRRDSLVEVEKSNLTNILAAILRKNIEEMPLLLNSNYRLIREIALWRLRINK